MLNPNAPSFHHRRPAFVRPVFYPPPPPPPLLPRPVLDFPYRLPAPVLLPSVNVFYDKCYVAQKFFSVPFPPPPTVYSEKTCTDPNNDVLQPPVSTTLGTEANTEIREAMRKTSFSVRDPRARRRKVLQVWTAKGSSHRSLCTYKAPDFDDACPTTVMIKNIPNRVSRDKLIEILDLHCVEMNKRGGEEAEKSSSQPPLFSEYDFVYLPMDFRNHCNLGYGFVNFTTRGGAIAFYNTYHSYKWEIYQSKKVCQVSSARIQGKAALVERFKNTTFVCHSDDYLPVQFTPPRNGSTSLSPPVLVGSRGSNREAS
ncbi:hypothetical protein H6P81_008149 [Aristolochia fimbriata]|uniref:Mei2-like C-terminal RNA recognition motif domain-containing protein n=1 Tax=Aristolochia fimbriata TaxID=158543 RepID=A0AAV7F4J6_ARIFI|nr:hypothetical protein H6P81_008149 [Aristolochia fimbriata]